MGHYFLDIRYQSQKPKFEQVKNIGWPGSDLQVKTDPTFKNINFSTYITKYRSGFLAASDSHERTQNLFQRMIGSESGPNLDIKI